METPKEAKEIFKEVDGMIKGPVNSENLSKEAREMLELISDNLPKALSITPFMKLQQLPASNDDVNILVDFVKESMCFCEEIPNLLTNAIYHDFMDESEKKSFNLGSCRGETLNGFLKKNEEFASITKEILFKTDDILLNIRTAFKDKPVAATCLCLCISTMKGL